MAGAYSKPLSILVLYKTNNECFYLCNGKNIFIKQIMNVFICAMVRIFSFGERWNVPFNWAVASLNGTFHLSPHENILTIALINIHYLYTGQFNLSIRSCILINFKKNTGNLTSSTGCHFKILKF
jgi:hypothetical protein